MASIRPKNAQNHDNNFFPLPQSTTETFYKDKPLSVFAGKRHTIFQKISDIRDFIANRIEVIIGGLLMLMALIFLLFLSRFILHLFWAPEGDPVAPEIVLNTLHVSNFSIGAEGLAAIWDTKITVKNTNNFGIYFTSIEFTLIYKQNREEAHALSDAYSSAFYLERRGSKNLHMRLITKGRGGWEDDNDHPFLENPLEEEIGKDRAKNGSLSFGMQMEVGARYYGTSLLQVLNKYGTGVVMTPHCEDLVVRFLPGKDRGRLVNRNRNFTVPIQWKTLEK